MGFRALRAIMGATLGARPNVFNDSPCQRRVPPLWTNAKTEIVKIVGPGTQLVDLRSVRSRASAFTERALSRASSAAENSWSSSLPAHHATTTKFRKFPLAPIQNSKVCPIGVSFSTPRGVPRILKPDSPQETRFKTSAQSGHLSARKLTPVNMAPYKKLTSY